MINNNARGKFCFPARKTVSEDVNIVDLRMKHDAKIITFDENVL
jgi:hypothetical protein